MRIRVYATGKDDLARGINGLVSFCVQVNALALDGCTLHENVAVEVTISGEDSGIFDEVGHGVLIYILGITISKDTLC